MPELTITNYSTLKSRICNDCHKRRYQAYLLRLWQEEESASWRILLEHPHTHEIVSFSSLENLMQFLNGQLPPEEEIKSLIPGGVV